MLGRLNAVARRASYLRFAVARSTPMIADESSCYLTWNHNVRSVSNSTSVGKMSQLGKLLHKEVVEEQHALEDAREEEQAIEELKGRLEDNGFEIKDVPGLSAVSLFKTGKGGEKIVVDFNVQDEEKDDQLDENEDEVEDEEEEDEESEAVFLFKVTVKKGEDSLVFLCNAGDSVYIRGVEFCPSGMPPETSHEYDDYYVGPDFEELDPSLQESFLTYLEEFGINKDVAEFVCTYSDMKEQKEYVRWLQNVRKFVG